MTRRGRPSLSDEVRDLVVQLRRTGMSLGNIAKKLQIGKSSVERIVRGGDSHGKPSHKSREGAG